MFSRKKKLQRDRDAGMVFHWRGGRSGNRGGLSLAIVFAVGICAALGFGINVNVRKPRHVSKKQANVVIVPADYEKLQWWSDQFTPFPSRWDPATDESVKQRVQSMLVQTLRENAEHDPQWLPMPDPEVVNELPSLVLQGERVLPELPKAEVPDRVEKATTLLLSVEGDKVLSKRIPAVLPEFKQDIPRSWYGSENRWFVVVDAMGYVVHCAPSSVSNEEMRKVMEPWLRALVFSRNPAKPEEAGEVLMKIEVKQ